MHSTLTLGGNVFLCFEDFRQLLPVVKHGSQYQILNACLKRSKLFSLFKTFCFKQNMCLQALHYDKNADSDAKQLPLYLLNIGESMLQVNEKASIQPLSSTRPLKDISTLIL